MDGWIIRLIEQGGYWGIAALMFVENIFPPIPSELIMGLGGVFVARGTMQFWPLMLAGTVGSTLGNYAWFLAGDKLGYERLRPLVRRHGRWLTINWRDVEAATGFFQKHGQWIVFFLRFSPFLRTLISLPAGLTHMKHWKFLVFTFAGAAVWNALLIVGGHWLADTLKSVDHLIGPAIAAMMGLAFVVWLYRVIRWRPEAD